MSVASSLTEKAFESRRKKSWEALDTICLAANARGLAKLDPEDAAKLPPLYRDVCSDLAAAEAARYGAPLVEYLRGLAATAHGVLYARAAARPSAPRDWLVAFPRAVRKRWRAMTLSLGLFFVPLVIGLVLSLRDPAFAFRIVPESMLRPLADAYAKGFDAGRGGGEGTMMAGFYVYNNVGIALRCFACGIFGGIGSALYLVQNGLSIGAMFGFITAHGAGGNLGVFVIGHSSLELGAIVIAGGAGLSLGWSIVAPGAETRLVSLQRAARELLVIVAGAAVMLLGAAGIEAFWSASSLSDGVKVAFGAVLFVLVNAFILFAGRGRA